MENIKLMIVDDHSIVREGLKYLLEKNGHIRVVAEADDGVQCLHMLSNVSPDVLLLDIDMPNMNGLDVLKKINEPIKKIKVIVLTGHYNYRLFLKAIEIGIDGYFLKNIKSEELEKAILQVYRGNVSIQMNLFSCLDVQKEKFEKENVKIKSLTKREMEVLKCLTIGMYNKEIALKLGISERTVKNHISNLFKKIGVADRTQAAVFAIRNYIVDIRD